MNRPVRLGLLGIAHGHVTPYVEVCRTLPGVQLIGLTDHDTDRARSAAERLAIPLLPDAETLLAQSPDGVIICSENAFHAPLVRQAAPRVPYILCEKPLATTEQDALAIVHACQVAGTQLQVAFPFRHAPPIRRLRDLLAAGDLGEVYAVKCTIHGRNPGGWYVTPDLAGGGVVMDLPVHVIDLLRWFWETEVTEVYAEIGESLLSPGLGIDDAGLLTLSLANGIYASLSTGWSRPPAYPTWGDVTIEVVGARGTVTVDVWRQALLATSTTWGNSRYVPWGSNMYTGLIGEFVDLIRRGAPATIPATDGLAAQRVVAAAYASAQRRVPVTPLQTVA